MGNYISTNKMTRIWNKQNKDFREIIEWLNRISREQHKRLKNYLITLDKSHRVDVNSNRTWIVHRGVTEIVERISKRIGEYDSRFTGTLLPMGSANNHTKLGDSNEFDFVHELDLYALLERRGTFKQRYNEEIVLNMDSGAACEMVKCVREARMLNRDETAALFHGILSKVLSELALPPGWQHGGVCRPTFGGVSVQGPSCVLQFDYLNTSDQVPLRLSVDFVPMIKLPMAAVSKINELDSFLSQVTKIEYCWISIREPFINYGVIYYGHAEELFLNKYSAESTPKTLMRVLKALRIISHMAFTSYPDESRVKELLRKYSEPGTVMKPDLRRRFGVKLLLRLDDYVSYSDLGETGADSYMMKTYCIKYTVLYMMSVDESHGHGWTDDDLPELVIMALRLLRHIIFVNFEIGANYDQQKISVPIEEVCKPTTRKGSPDSPPTQKRSTASKLVEAKLFLPTGAPRYRNRVLIDHDSIEATSRFACIFQLFKCVCEGRGTAKLIILHFRPPDFDWGRLVSKKELKKLRDQVEKTHKSRDTETDASDDT